jgi:hypothetical protein
MALFEALTLVRCPNCSAGNRVDSVYLDRQLHIY